MNESIYYFMSDNKNKWAVLNAYVQLLGEESFIIVFPYAHIIVSTLNS